MSIRVASACKMADFSYTSANTAGTTAGTAQYGFGVYGSLWLYAELTGATGGTLDVYLQTSPDGGTTWVDYAHWPQVAGGASVILRSWAVSRGAEQKTLTTVGKSTSPALAANTIVGGAWGDGLRIVSVAGAGTSAGAAQVIKLFCS